MGIERPGHRIGAVIDLETLIADRQNVLRGRPRGWCDEFGDRWHRIDWPVVAFIGFVLLVRLAALVVVL